VTLVSKHTQREGGPSAVRGLERGYKRPKGGGSGRPEGQYKEGSAKLRDDGNSMRAQGTRPKTNVEKETNKKKRKEDEKSER